MKTSAKTVLIVFKMLLITGIAVLCIWKYMQESAAVGFEAKTLPETTSEFSASQIVTEDVPETEEVPEEEAKEFGGPAPGNVDRVVRLKGSPEALGTQHGTKLKKEIGIMLAEYLKYDTGDQGLNPDMRRRVQVMKLSLPEWFIREVKACAQAADVDEDMLLFAQCEGDVRSLAGCTSFAAFDPSSPKGVLEIGRNFDYWGLKSTETCTVVFSVVPRKEDGYVFVSVGWAGILGGWTFFNEKGLFVANNLGGFEEKDPEGVPTLILERMIAQKAATLDEAIAIVKKTPRMRGQVLVLGYTGNPEKNVPPDGAVVRYDAERVEVEKARNGFAFYSSIGFDRETVREILVSPGIKPVDAIKSAGNMGTLHSVVVRPHENRIWVAHGRQSYAHLGSYIKYDLKKLLQ